jgi:hypothetical protein
MFQIGLCLLAGSALGGCATPTPAAPLPPIAEVSSILVLPSAAQAVLAVETGIGAGDAIQARNQLRLGGSPISGAGPSFVLRSIRDDQRIINGRNQSTFSLRVRTGSQRHR